MGGTAGETPDPDHGRKDSEGKEGRKREGCEGRADKKQLTPTRSQDDRVSPRQRSWGEWREQRQRFWRGQVKGKVPRTDKTGPQGKKAGK